MTEEQAKAVEALQNALVACNDAGVHVAAGCESNGDPDLCSEIVFWEIDKNAVYLYY